MSTPNLPAAFEKCTLGHCPEPEFVALGAKEEEVKAGKPDKEKRACKEGCRCELFFAKTEDDEKERKWQFAYPNADGKVLRQGAREKDKGKAEYTYRFYCVKLIFDDDGYTTEDGSCPDPKAKRKEKGKETEATTYYCPPSDNCGQCRLFRLKRDARDSKWEFVAIGGSAAAVEIDPKTYYYRCICVTPA